MALVLLNPGTPPLGQFDGYDGEYLAFKGGEVCKMVAVDIAATDKSVSDVADGYAGNTLKTRPVITKIMGGGATEGPLFLADDGTANYGTLFGQVVGGIAGQIVTGGTVLGPSTAAGSGKITLWDKPGLYGVTLDACDTAANGLVAANSALASGTTTLSYTTGGLLTPEGAGSNKASSARTVGRFVEFSQGNVLVSTPSNLTRVLVSGGKLTFKYAVFTFNAGV